jgi:hypothetical protein
MTIYIIILIILLYSYIIEHIEVNKTIKNKNTISQYQLIFIILFLMCALRSSSVGRDIPGYELVYEWTKEVDFNNFNYVYFENGYIFLSKICIFLGINFQYFLSICYAIILLPLYLFINKYSKDKILSIIIFVCYIYFEFDLTGLRQAISMSISLIGLMILLNKNRLKYFYFILVITIAILFHKGAYICLLILPFMLITDIIVYTLSIISVSFISLLLRKYLLVQIKDFFGKASFSTEANIYIGLNFIFLLLVGVFFLIIQVKEKKVKLSNNIIECDLISNYQADDFFLKIYFLSIIVALFFGKETSARSYMYLNQVLIVLLPNNIIKLPEKDKMVFSTFLVAFLFIFFIINTLIHNPFDIVPYKFYWQ